jgi:hypothetical protein
MYYSLSAGSNGPPIASNASAQLISRQMAWVVGVMYKTPGMFVLDIS